jgi:hypothetical protein
MDVISSSMKAGICHTHIHGESVIKRLISQVESYDMQQQLKHFPWMFV